MRPEAFFLPATQGQRFCLFYAAESGSHGGGVRGLVVYIHPFAEEMNKSRRMAALQSRALAQAGFSVLQIDLLGCGDSSGDFGDATWQSWIADVVQGCHWLRNRSDKGDAAVDGPPLWLWGLRAGCLLAAAAANELTEDCNFLFWQPPATGKSLLQQFLRLKAAGGMLGGEGKGVMDRLRQEFSAGSSVEIAGYLLSSELASGLERAALVPPSRMERTSRLEWFELSTRQDAGLSPAAAATIANWQQAGFRVDQHVASGPAFWQTSEIEDAPALLAATSAALLMKPA